MTYKELGEKVAEQALDYYLINGKTMREWINILSDNMSVLEQIRAEIAEYKDDKVIHAEQNEMIDIVLEILDKYR